MTKNINRNGVPLLSIVIANYNYGRFLEDALKSIIMQCAGGDVEVIVCDAASTDNSLEIIKKYSKGLPPKTHYVNWRDTASPNLSCQPLITWWCSEKDGGQSAAFNKGFCHARGKFLTWLNADDVLLPGTIRKFKSAYESNPEFQWFGGGCLYLDPELRVFKCGRCRRISMTRAKHGVVNVTGPSSIFSRALYEEVGGIDERYQYTMDTNLWIKFALEARAKYMPFSRYIWGLRMHPDAKMSGHKFTSDGHILEGKSSLEAYQRNQRRLEQLTREKEWSMECAQISRKRMSKLQRLMSVDVVPALMSRFDTWRFRGKDYLSVVK